MSAPQYGQDGGLPLRRDGQPVDPFFPYEDPCPWTIEGAPLVPGIVFPAPPPTTGTARWELAMRAVCGHVVRGPAEFDFAARAITPLYAEWPRACPDCGFAPDSVRARIDV